MGWRGIALSASACGNFDLATCADMRHGGAYRLADRR